MKKILCILLLMNSFNVFGASSYSDLFKSPYKQSQPTTYGNAGPSVAQLSASCKKLQSSPLFLLSQFWFPKIWSETTPVIPFVGIVTGITQHESILFKVCNVLIQMDQVGFAKSIHSTAQFLNELTGNQFNAEYELFDSFHNFANSVYDFDKGNTRPGAMKNAQNHHKLMSLANQSVKYYNTRINERGAEKGIETKAERRTKLQKISRLSYQRAILSEAASCPAPRGTTDFQKKYSKYVNPRKVEVREADQEVQYYHQQMARMGVEINTELEDMQDYANRLKQLSFNSVRYVTSTGYHEKQTSVITNRVDRNGKPIRKDKVVKKKVNIFNVFPEQQVINSFKKKYVEKWESWVESQLLTSGTYGLLDGKKGRIEAKFKNYSFECSEVRLSRQISPSDKSDPLYRTNLDKARKKCMDQLKIRNNQAKNLLDEYINRLIQALTRKYKSQAEIWNFEAIELGYNRAVSTNQSDDLSFQEMEVACSETLTTAEIKHIKMKSNSVNTSLKEAWMTYEVEKTEKQKIREEANAQNRKRIRDQAEKDLGKARSPIKPQNSPMSLQPDGGI